MSKVSMDSFGDMSHLKGTSRSATADKAAQVKSTGSQRLDGASFDHWNSVVERITGGRVNPGKHAMQADGSMMSLSDKRGGQTSQSMPMSQPMMEQQPPQYQQQQQPPPQHQAPQFWATPAETNPNVEGMGAQQA
ncbi:unnamed protein product, partial [marine sediment metagenome]